MMPPAGRSPLTAYRLGDVAPIVNAFSQAISSAPHGSLIAKGLTVGTCPIISTANAS